MQFKLKVGEKVILMFGRYAVCQQLRIYISGLIVLTQFNILGPQPVSIACKIQLKGDEKNLEQSSSVLSDDEEIAYFIGIDNLLRMPNPNKELGQLL